MPPNTVSIARPTRWGNPFTIEAALDVGYFRPTDNPVLQRAFLVDAFRDWLSGSERYWMGAPSDKARDAMLSGIHELRGKNLACWCPLVDVDGNPMPCHADILLEIANP